MGAIAHYMHRLSTEKKEKNPFLPFIQMLIHTRKKKFEVCRLIRREKDQERLAWYLSTATSNSLPPRFLSQPSDCITLELSQGHCVCVCV